MDEEHDQQDEGGGLVGRHLSKRSRKNKGLVVVFDPDAREEFVTGFHKRKKKRRKLAEKQKQLKDRLKRLQARKERRLALAEVVEHPGSEEDEEGEAAGEEDGGGETPSELDQSHVKNGTVMYDDENMTTIVNTYSIEMDGRLNSLDRSKASSRDTLPSMRRLAQGKRKKVGSRDTLPSTRRLAQGKRKKSGASDRKGGLKRQKRRQ